ncbi:hypothetical protein CFOL_v3_26506 [Cephalotus follicularis]|uniref:Uncharacterized protein n=1 Tax=Cephalotus follicularis TaxID=3775 RepID=A0A1Q3CSA4_CEPFO|nr:hypothetical protein CFOL_v3_26506 [Cephalotus follicularis]
MDFNLVHHMSWKKNANAGSHPGQPPVKRKKTTATDKFAHLSWTTVLGIEAGSGSHATRAGKSLNVLIDHEATLRAYQGMTFAIAQVSIGLEGNEIPPEDWIIRLDESVSNALTARGYVNGCVLRVDR